MDIPKRVGPRRKRDVTYLDVVLWGSVLMLIILACGAVFG